MIADQRLISQLRDRAEPAIDALFDAYYDRVYRYLAQLVADPELAADLTQDTFVKVYAALPRLSDDSNLTAWIFHIATRVARSHFRRRRIIQWLPLDAWSARSAGHEEHIAQNDAVAMALNQLSPEYRTCLLLYSWAGLSCPEIGVALGKSEEATRMLLSRARRQFQRYYTAASAIQEVDES